MRADPAGSELYRQSWYYFTQTIWKRGTVLNVDLDAGDLSRIESLRRLAVVAASQTDSGPFFSTLSMRYAIRFRDQQPIAGFRRFGGDAFRSWDENPGALPDIRLASSWREASGPVDALGTLPGLPAEEIVVETGERGAPGTRGRGSCASAKEVRSVFSSRRRPRIRPGSSSSAATGAIGPSRSTELPVETYPAQLAFTAVPVPEGAHRIEWRERAPGLEISRYGPLAGVLLLLVTARRRRAE